MSKIPPTAVIEDPARGGGEGEKKGVRSTTSFEKQSFKKSDLSF